MSPRRCISPAGRVTIQRDGEELIAATSGQLRWAAARAWKSTAAGAAAGGCGSPSSSLAVQRSVGSGFLAVLLALSAAGNGKATADAVLQTASAADSLIFSGGGRDRVSATTFEWPEV
jgi:hypothetical protein